MGRIGSEVAVSEVTPPVSDRKATPLWIIGTFVGVSEVVAGVTVINTEGVVQVASLAFMAIFTSGVAAAFFHTLWRRSEVFFPPDQYRDVDIKEFVEFVGSGRVSRERRVVKEVTKEVADQLVHSGIETHATENGKLDPVRKVIEDIEANFIDVIFYPSDFSVVQHSPVRLSLYASGWTSVSDFLNEVFFGAHESGIALPVYTYGEIWALRNTRTGELIKKLNSGEHEDAREFAVLGIQAGDVLEAVKLSKPMSGK